MGEESPGKPNRPFGSLVDLRGSSKFGIFLKARATTVKRKDEDDNYESDHHHDGQYDNDNKSAKGRPQGSSGS